MSNAVELRLAQHLHEQDQQAPETVMKPAARVVRCAELTSLSMVTHVDTKVSTSSAAKAPATATNRSPTPVEGRYP